MSAKVTLPILKEARNQGHEIVIVAEGRAVQVCTDAGWPLWITGTDELVQLEQKSIEGVFKATSAQLLLIGCSAPINWELAFAQVAREFNIPVVAIEDIWGGLSRLS